MVVNNSRFFQSGKLKFRYSSSGMDFELGEQRRHLDSKQLPVYANDCNDGGKCSPQRRTFCEACIKYLDGVAWDERRQRVFFAIATDTAKNKPWILIGYDFKSDRVTRYGEFYGGGAGEVAFSPSGRYLSMVGYGVCGGCCTSSYLMVADLAEHRIGAKRLQNTAPDPDAPRNMEMIEKTRWLSESEVAYEEQSYTEKDCSSATGELQKKVATRTIKVSEITF
jgi:hypothetical protein